MAGPVWKTLALELDGTRFTLVSDVVQDQTSGKYVIPFPYQHDLAM